MSQELDEIIDDLLGAYPTDEPPKVVEGEDQAVTLMRRIRRIRFQQEEDTRLIRKEIVRLQGIVDEREGVHQRQIEHQRAPLEQWHRTMLAEGTVPKTKRFGHGDSVLRASSVQVDMNDERAFLEWAYEHAPELLKISYDAKAIRDLCSKIIAAELSPDRKDLPASVEAVTDDGEVLPGEISFHRKPATHSIMIERLDTHG